ncbi:L,D-transpeptidase [uncultured Piscinibacter sp.]|uniref:L,D-transpeptidase n=1 Tax=uncultured Piscinibacter sp. TaxID=1131835 RepID=UPI00260F6501|nr:L,D-transpeptidase [uncultured Piscinibacter sp.]
MMQFATKMHRRTLLAALATGLPLAPALANVPFWGDKASRSVETPSDELKPGQWVWSAQEAPQGPVLVVVNLDQQVAYAYRNGVLIGTTTISTGKKGHRTPVGVFQTLQKDKHHRSSKYNNAPMPYTQRLTWDGVALHAGGLPGYPSSHGCVHLPSGFAEKLFEVSPLGMTVVVAKGERTPLDLRHPLPISPIDPRTGTVEHEPRLSDQEHFRWSPQNAPDGPVSLVVSRADARVIVMRGGIEIGRSRVTITNPPQPFGTHAFIAHAHDAATGSATGGRLRWVGVAVPGHAGDAGRTLTAEDFSRVRLPKDFLDALRPALAPGSALVVTDAPILPDTTGAPMTVVTNQPPET